MNVEQYPPNLEIDYLGWRRIEAFGEDDALCRLWPVEVLTVRMHIEEAGITLVKLTAWHLSLN